MSFDPTSQTSIESFSLKFTQTNLPSSSLIKLSQDHISLTYTVSLQNVSLEKLEFPQIQEIDDLSTSIERQTIKPQNNRRIKKNFKKDKEILQQPSKDTFKKKSLLKINNFDLSQFLQESKLQQKLETPKPKKSFIRSNNSGLFSKNKIIPDSCYPKTQSKIKDFFNGEENMSSSTTIRTSRFYSMKNDLQTTRPINFSVKKSLDKRISTCDTERKIGKFPIIKGSNFHLSAPASLNKNRKVNSMHENAQVCEKILIGKTCVLRQNDQKAKKYLQKVIENRSSVTHYSDNKKSRLFKDFKQSMEQI